MKHLKSIVSMLLSALIVLNLMPISVVKGANWPTTSWQDSNVPITDWYVEGKGGQDNPYVITTAEQLAGLAKLTNSGTSFMGKYIKLDADIDLGGKNWVSIGTSANRFIGYFDGNYHIIKNLTQYATSSLEAGLFGWIDTSKASYVSNDTFSIKNLGVVDVNIDGEIQRGGALAAYVSVSGSYTYSSATSIDAACENCFSTGYIHSNNITGIIGGLFGEVNISNGDKCSMTISNCYSTCDISLTYKNEGSSYHGYAGGLVGHIFHSNQVNDMKLFIKNSYSASKVTTTNTNGNYIGGFVGVVSETSQITISDCIFDTQVAGIGYAFDKTSAQFNGVQSRSTVQMVGTGALPDTWDKSVWQTQTDLYPQLKGFNNISGSMASNSSLASAIPIFLFDNIATPGSGDTSANVRHSFKVPVISGVTWIANPSNILTFPGSGNVTFKSPVSDTEVTVTAQLGAAKKDFVILCKSGVISGDTIAPVITFGDITPSDFSASIITKSDEIADIYVLAKAASEAAPSANQIINDGKTLKGNGQEFTTSVSSLNHTTNYIVYAVGVDSSGNVSEVKSETFTTLMDKTSPVNTGKSNIFINGSKVSFSLGYNEPGTIKYVVVPSTLLGPSEAQIAAGQNEASENANYSFQSEYVPVSPWPEYMFDITNFPKGDYNIFVLFEDEHGNKSGILKLSFTTQGADITSFEVPGQKGSSIIDSIAHTVVFHMPEGTDVSELIPTVGVSDKATKYFLEGAKKDFTNPVSYIVISESGTWIVWSVTCIVDKTLKSIAITKPADKLTYTMGEELDITGMEVAGTYSDNSIQALSITTANVSGFDSSVVGSQMLKVTVDGKEATYLITVEAAPVTNISVTGVSLSKPTLILTAGGVAETLTATVAPMDATNKSVAWSSSNDNIATVADGVVTPIAEGKATITVTTADGSKIASCEVTVQAAPVTNISVTGVSLNQPTLTLTAGGVAETLTATVAPMDATNKSVAWSSSNDSIATVTDGVVTPIAEGKATITVTTADGSKTASCEVTVQVAPVTNISVTGVSLNQPTLTLTAGGAKGTLTATVAPMDATNKNVAWSSSNTNVATVINGVVTPVGIGTTSITTTTTDGKKTASCIVTVVSQSTHETDPVPVISTPTPSPSPTPTSAQAKPTTTTETIIDKTTGATISIQVKIQINKDGTASVALAAATVATSARDAEIADNKAKIKVTVPYENIVKAAEAATEDKPLEVDIQLPTLVKDLIKSEKVNEVELEVIVPSELTKNKKVNVNTIKLEKDIIEAAKAAEKDIKVSAKDEKGREMYSWSFDGSGLKTSEKEVTGVNLALSVVPVKDLTEDKAAIRDAVSKQENGNQGLVINFNHSGELPSTADVRVYVGNQEGIKSGSKVNLYYINSKTGKLENLPDSEYTVDEDGYVTVRISHCSSYLVLPKIASETEKALEKKTNTSVKQANIPFVNYVKAPVFEYKVGDIVNFDLHASNYEGRVQYRVVLWDGNKKEARDLWTAGDRYYTNWMPYSNNTFNLHWRIDAPGIYRITVYVKRAGIQNSDTALKGYNCDSYMESEVFVVK